MDNSECVRAIHTKILTAPTFPFEHVHFVGRSMCMLQDADAHRSTYEVHMLKRKGGRGQNFRVHCAYTLTIIQSFPQCQ